MSDKEIEYPFTAYPNHIIDELMPDIDGNTFKVLTVVIRKTIGYHKKVDKIALSQFKSHSGLSKNTIIKSLNLLCEKKIIKKYTNGCINKYGMVCIEDKKHDKPGSKFTTPASGADIEHPGSKVEPASVHMLNPSGVQGLNTQKKPTKEEVDKVIRAWNSRFDVVFSPSDHKMVDHVCVALQEVSVQEMIQAMDNRLTATYYREKKPELLHRPDCFFPYLRTIRTDLQRRPDNLYTHKEYERMITEKGYHGNDFVVRKGQGEIMWELKQG
jgi:phage replication O-like protein O